MNRALARKAAPAVLAGAVAATALMLAPRPAGAYVRYKTEVGAAFYWPQNCVPVTVYPADSPDMTPDQIMHAVTAAATAWGSGQSVCTTYLHIDVTSSTAATPAAKFDYFNNLVFRHDSWCKVNDPTMCYDAAALAITSVFVSTRDGKIRDGDVEVNERNFVWADADLDPTRGKQDLQNALTHEFGHLIGLDHTCFIAVPGAVRPVDNTGAPVPDCDQASDEVRETTMFASALPGDVSKRTLAPDDAHAVCDIYPLAQDPMVCPPAGPPTAGAQPGCGCSTGAGTRGGFGGASALAATATALMLARARRRRRQP